MNKEQKIKELEEKINTLTKELEELSKNKGVECFANKIKTGDKYVFIKSDGELGDCVYYETYIEHHKSFNNVFEPGSLNEDDLNQQKIINRIRQLSKKFNPEGWDWTGEVETDRGVYELAFSYAQEKWSANLLYSYFSPMPKFKYQEHAQAAADDLNAKGYHL